MVVVIAGRRARSALSFLYLEDWQQGVSLHEFNRRRFEIVQLLGYD